MLSWILSPYVRLLASVLGVALGIAVVALIAPRRTLPATAALAVAVLLGFDLLPHLWQREQGLGVNRQTLRLPAGLPAVAGPSSRCFVDAGAAPMVGFVDWLRQRIPAGDRFATEGGLDAACLQLNMLPRLLVQRPAQARWVVLLANPLPRSILSRARRETALPESQRTVFVYDSQRALVRRA